jgi:hypothetical protein
MFLCRPSVESSLTIEQEIMLDLSMRQSLRVHKALGMKL